MKRTILLCALWLALASVACAAAPVQADWTHWQHLIDTHPAEAQRTLGALDLGTWPEPDRLRASLMQAHSLVELGRTTEAQAQLERLREPVQRQAAQPLLALWEVLYGVALQEPAQRAQRREHLARGLALARAAGDVPLQSYALLHRASDALDARDYRGAAAELEADGPLVRASGNPHLQARHLYWLGIMQIDVGDHVHAEQSLREAAQRFRGAGNRTWESDSERNLAEMHIDADRPREALQPAQRATELLQTLDDPVYLANARSALAVALAAHGRIGEALPLVIQAELTLSRWTSASSQLRARMHHARVLLLSGNPAAAEHLLRTEAQPLLPGAELRPDLQRRWQLLLAETLSALNRTKEAEAAWRAVIRLDNAAFERSLHGQLEAQRGTLETQRLLRENELLQSRAQAAEQAVQADARTRALAGGAAAVALGGALAGLWWLRRMNHHISAVAATDPLTGLHNRRSVLALGEQALTVWRSQGQPLAVLLLDLDHFKQVNDSAGHAAGDEALRQVAERLRQGLRRSDHLARWGGEEFLLLLPGARLGEALALAERQRVAVAEADFNLTANGQRWPLTISIGVAAVQAGDGALQPVIDRADAALYRAKQAGRNRVAGPQADEGTAQRQAA